MNQGLVDGLTSVRNNAAKKHREDDAKWSLLLSILIMMCSTMCATSDICSKNLLKELKKFKQEIEK